MKNFRNYIYFDLALFLYIIWGCLRDADINLGSTSYLGVISKYVIYASTLLSFTSILLRYPLKIWHLILFLYVVGMAIVYKQVYLYWPVFGLSFLLFASYKIKVDHIIKSIFFSTLLTTSVVIMLSLLGILSDRVYAHKFGEGVIYDAHSFGFAYYSFFAFRMMLLIILLLYLNRNRCGYLKLLAFVLLSYGIYYLSFTRLQIVTNLSIIILYTIVFKFKIISLESNLWKYVALITYPFSFLFFVSLPLASFVSPVFLDLWDELFSGRMAQTLFAFTQYPITLFGNKFEMVGGVQGDDGMAADYFYIDSGYAYWLLAYGIIFTIFIMFIYTRVLYKSYLYKNKFIYIWCFFFAFVTLINDFFTSSYWNPIIFLLFADFSNKRVIRRNPILLTQRHEKGPLN